MLHAHTFVVWRRGKICAQLRTVVAMPSGKQPLRFAPVLAKSLTSWGARRFHMHDFCSSLREETLRTSHRSHSLICMALLSALCCLKSLPNPCNPLFRLLDRLGVDHSDFPRCLICPCPCYDAPTSRRVSSMACHGGPLKKPSEHYPDNHYYKQIQLVQVSVSHKLMNFLQAHFLISQSTQFQN